MSNSIPPIITLRDTVKEIKLETPITIRDTIRRTRIVNLPANIDTNVVNDLIAQRDSLALLLLNQKVASVAVLDTIHAKTLDTFKIKYFEYDRSWDVYLGLAPRKIHIDKEFIYLPPPKREWWDNPLVGGLGGFLLGGVSGLIIGVSLK
ncbi:hypothetical protein EG832_22045 [bacterium]|nr:hypothetical protein [bacterium]